MLTLIDTSIWIDYFKGNATDLDHLIDSNLLATNDVILAELVPALRLRGEHELVNLLNEVKCFQLNIDWENIMQMQLTCMQSGANGIGLPDLIIAQNALHNKSKVYSKDKHFRLMGRILGLPIYPSEPH